MLLARCNCVHEWIKQQSLILKENQNLTQEYSLNPGINLVNTASVPTLKLSYPDKHLY